jgi:predicted Zn-dependent protease
MSVKKTLTIVLVVAALLFASGWLPVLPCFFESRYVPIDKSQLHGTGPIYFVPLGDFSPIIAKDLAQYYNERYGITVEVISSIRLPDSAFNPQRKQYEAESLLASLKTELRPLLIQPQSVAIALTDEDLYIASYKWRYAFGYRDAPYAIVSSSRMNHALFGIGSASAEHRASRFRKMVTKNIGVLYYGLPLSSHCRSAMYGKVGGPQELDVMGEDF